MNDYFGMVGGERGNLTFICWKYHANLGLCYGVDAMYLCHKQSMNYPVLSVLRLPSDF